MPSVRLLPYKDTVKVILLDFEDTIIFDNSKYYPSLKNGVINLTRQEKKDGKKRSISLHRDILGIPVGDKRIVQHRNGNRFDNQKSNLIIHADRDAYVNSLP